jgi:hypothetical protein
VDPDYRGSSLMQRMLGYIETNAIDEGRKHSIIQIAVDNPASWINALHHGMSITKVDNDPSDGVKVIYLEKDITPKTITLPFVRDNQQTYSMFLGNDIHKKIPTLFNKMQYLVESGYQGIYLDKGTQSLIWQKDMNSNEETMGLGFMLQKKMAEGLGL